ncbi:unnamed protein product, partial [Meganyctiphanes norvegica]
SLSSLSVCRMDDAEKRKILVHGNLSHARAIVLDPAKGYMYWTVWQFTVGLNENGAKIEVAWMDGTNRRDFVNTGLQWPNGLSIDYENRFLYWCDGFFQRIERIGLDGSNRKVILNGPHLNHPYGIAYHSGIIYWSEFQNGTIKKATVNNPEDAITFQVENPYIFDVKVFANDSQLTTNNCTNNDFKCFDLCLATPEGPHCDCPTGFQIGGENNNLCDPILNFTQPILCDEDQFQCKKNLRCIDRRYLCDGDNDCLDNSDEDSSPGGVCDSVECDHMFKCKSNNCIESYFVCDGDFDCIDGSDEGPDVCEDPPCQPGQFRCEVSRRCIPPSWLCDIDNDCGPGDNSDEHDKCEYPECGPTELTCGNKRCLPNYYVCDGDDDCRDGTDEMFCETFCASANKAGLATSPYCSNICLNITTKDACNSNAACHTCTDEEVKCLGLNQICDGVPDCEDGADEESCDPVPGAECGSEEFQCTKLRECIPKVF